MKGDGLTERVERLLKLCSEDVVRENDGVLRFTEGQVSRTATRLMCLEHPDDPIAQDLDVLVYPSVRATRYRVAATTRAPSDVLLLSEQHLEDQLFGAAGLAEWLVSSRSAGEYSLPRELAANIAQGDLYVYPVLHSATSRDDVTRQLREWVTGEQTSSFESRLVMVSADAGLGKSELTKSLERRAATHYRNVVSRDPAGVRPPLAVRIPLRGLKELRVADVCERLEKASGRPVNALLFDHLFRSGRITLLLDGLDELASPGDVIEEGLLRMAEAARSGARVLVTTRTGLTNRRGTPLFLQAAAAGSDMPDSAGLILKEFDAGRANELLGKAGLNDRERADVIARLPPELSGIPLFLIWSCVGSRSIDRGLRRPASIRSLILSICDREWLQEGMVETADQFGGLCRLAMHSLDRELDEDDLRLAIDGFEYSQFVDGPHALLRRVPASTKSEYAEEDQGYRYEFVHNAFRTVLAASRIAELWGSRDGDDLHRLLVERFGPPNYAMELLVESLAAFLGPLDVKRAWTAVRGRSEEIARIRGALFRIALTRVGDGEMRGDHSASAASDRAKRLEDELGDRSLTDVQLDRAVIQHLDLKGWELARVRSAGAEFQYCDFSEAEMDDSLVHAEFADCEGLTRATHQGRWPFSDSLFQPWRTGVARAGYSGAPRLADLRVPPGVLDLLEQERVVRVLVSSDGPTVELVDRWRSVARACANRHSRLLTESDLSILKRLHA